MDRIEDLADPTPRKMTLRFKMYAEIRRAKAEVERELAPREGLYLRDR